MIQASELLLGEQIEKVCKQVLTEMGKRRDSFTDVECSVYPLNEWAQDVQEGKTIDSYWHWVSIYYKADLEQLEHLYPGEMDIKQWLCILAMYRDGVLDDKTATV